MSLRNRIKVKKTVSLCLTAEDWQLYDLPGAGLAAKGLNIAVENAVNSGMGINEAAREVEKTMEALGEYGASDTEPRYVLDDLINLIYGDSTV